MITDWLYEFAAQAQGFSAICGIDEAGRGPLAGPVVAAAVILPLGVNIDGVDDSKKLTEKRREALFDTICAQALCYHVASVDERMVDEINILNATFLAMRQAVKGLQPPSDFALVDGSLSQGLAIPFTCVVHGDALSPSIAAASILAKVTRDRYMREMAVQYPGYGFERHKGYGSAAHYAALDSLGACPLHRQTFLRKYYAKKALE